MHAGEPSGLPGADPFGHVSEDSDGRVGRKPGIEQRGALALGEPGLAGGAPEQPASLARPIPHRHGQVAVVPLPVVRAVRVEATEPAEVVIHDRIPGQTRMVGKLQPVYPITLPACNTDLTPPILPPHPKRNEPVWKNREYSATPDLIRV